MLCVTSNKTILEFKFNFFFVLFKFCVYPQNCQYLLCQIGCLENDDINMIKLILET